MSYTTNKQWSNPEVPKADGLWKFKRVLRDNLGRPCAYCGVYTKYLHEMLHPSIPPVLVGCTCHAHLLGIPYDEAKDYQTQFQKEEKIRLRLERQKYEEEKHDLIIVNGGMCPEGMYCPRCKARLELESKRLADERAAEWERTRPEREAESKRLRIEAAIKEAERKARTLELEAQERNLRIAEEAKRQAEWEQGRSQREAYAAREQQLENAKRAREAVQAAERDAVARQVAIANGGCGEPVNKGSHTFCDGGRLLTLCPSCFDKWKHGGFPKLHCPNTFSSAHSRGTYHSPFKECEICKTIA
jgi:hypothetical protein